MTREAATAVARASDSLIPAFADLATKGRYGVTTCCPCLLSTVTPEADEVDCPLVDEVFRVAWAEADI